jgi:hypothetical protein
VASSRAPRLDALDDLRGIAILAMMLSGAIPFGVLAPWMYHGQEPPPSHRYDPALPGITWVDLVFPFFLFAMGAAIPLALSRRLEKGEPEGRIALGAVARGGLLVAFAIFDQHVRPGTLAKPPAWETGLLAFGLAIAMFGRVPPTWPRWSLWLARAVGWGGAAWLLAGTRYPDGSGFRVERADVILLVLATCATVGSLVWLATRESFARRALAVALLAAWRLGAENPDSWAARSWWWEEGRLAQLVRPEFLGYLLVVIPGTVAGDLLRKREPSEGPFWRRAAGAAAGLTAPGAAVVVWHLRLPETGLLAFLALPWIVPPGRARSLARLGAAMFALALLLEPFQGGIKKDPPTFAYWLGGAGLAAFFLVGLDLLPRFPGRSLATLVGRNPMLAYLGVTNLIAPLWALLAAPHVRTATPGQGVAVAVAQTALLGLLVAGFTRSRVVLGT